MPAHPNARPDVLTTKFPISGNPNILPEVQPPTLQISGIVNNRPGDAPPTPPPCPAIPMCVWKFRRLRPARNSAGNRRRDAPCNDSICAKLKGRKSADRQVSVVESESRSVRAVTPRRTIEASCAHPGFCNRRRRAQMASVAPTSHGEFRRRD